jgi:predicted kinase
VFDDAVDRPSPRATAPQTAAPHGSEVPGLWCHVVCRACITTC